MIKKRFIAIALAAICLSGCSQAAKLPKGAFENEILTLAPIQQDKEMVTIHFEYGFGNASTFESAIEKNFPNVDVIMVHDGATDSTSLLEGNLKNGTEGSAIIYVASGLNVEFAPWMPAGQRLISCKLPDGTDLDPNGNYKVAYMSDKLFNMGEELAPSDEVILEGKFADHFAVWFANYDNTIKRPEQTTILNWKTEE